ncbi:hypothetical protein [Rhabdothermincola salaria]|uniref:hypothetical protein n=1 Tax=Rhabdothermincola salaria TaxID=2903142 RepID=UPI001E46927F|nr:hypothetical protein [Rhabdothermincola salaria]MCD9624508.1 hypothetical protein [Rhabdothermincola salaria]
MPTDALAVDATVPSGRSGDVLAPRRWARHERTAAWIVALLALAPLAVTTAASIGIDWRAAGDWAVIELRTRDVGTTLTPLLGPYSRYGWNHPGPWFFWLLAGPYRLLGSNPWGLLTAAAAVNLGAASAMLWLAWRRGGLAAVALLSAGVAVLAANLPAGQLWDPWNPWLTLLPFGVVVVATWAAVDGDRAGLAIAVAAGSYIVQAHVGFGVLVAGLLGLAVVATARQRRGERWWAVPALILAIAWIPVLLDQLFGVGNAVDLAEHFTSGSDEPLGWGPAVEITSRELAGWRPPWLGGAEPTNPVGGGTRGREAVALLGPIAVAVATVALAVWRECTTALRLLGVVALATLLGWVSVARLTGEPFDYLLRWWWIIAMLGTVAVALTLWGALPDRFRVPVVLAAASLVVVVPAGLSTVRAIDRDAVPNGDFVPAILSVSDPMVAALRDDDVDSVTLSGTGPLAGWLTDAVTAVLDDAGIEVRTPPEQRHKFGTQRSEPAPPGTPELVVATGPTIDEALARPDAVAIARWDPLPPSLAEERAEVTATLRAQLLAAGRDDLVAVLDDGNGLWEATVTPGVDPDLVARRDELQRDGVPLAIVMVPPAGD